MKRKEAENPPYHGSQMHKVMGVEMRGLIGAVTVVVAAATAVAASAAQTSWATQADKVCTVWTAKAKKVMSGGPPQTAPAAYAFSVKAVALEQGELAALSSVPNPTAAGNRALRSVSVDIAEIRVGLKDWRAGNKAGFVRVYNIWQADHRPHRAFLAAGAKVC